MCYNSILLHCHCCGDSVREHDVMLLFLGRYVPPHLRNSSSIDSNRGFTGPPAGKNTLRERVCVCRVHACMCVCVCMCACVCMQVGVCMCAYVHAYLHACMHVHVCVIFTGACVSTCRICSS